MCAISEVSLITSNIQNIIDFGLTDRAMTDFRLASYSCTALLKMVPSKLSQEDPNPPRKYEPDHQLFQKIENLLVEVVTQYWTVKSTICIILARRESVVRRIITSCRWLRMLWCWYISWERVLTSSQLRSSGNWLVDLLVTSLEWKL